MKTVISLQHLTGISTKFLQPLSPENTYEVLLQEAKELFHADYGSIFLRHGRKWHRVYSTVPQDQQITPRARGFSYTVFKTQTPLLISKDVFTKTHPKARKTKLQSLIIIPLSYNNQSLGILALQSKKKIKLTKKQEELLKLFASLATLAIKKTELYEDSKNALKMRDLFISLAAHELRTPLTTINAYVQFFKKKIHTNSSENVWVEQLSLETNHIIRLVNELLNVDLIKHGVFSYHMKPLSFHVLVKRSLQQFSLSYPFYTVLIKDTTIGKDTIIGDPDKLLQMMHSLFQNAAQFSNPEKVIHLFINEDSTSFSMEIVDKGIGIPRKDIQHIFSGFYKGSNNYKDGIGLGLFLSKQIIEKHKGSLSIQTKQQKGTSVKVVLPKLRL